MKTTRSHNKILNFNATVQPGWEKNLYITDFKLVQKLGVGSLGTVYKAIHKKTKKVYAIKQIKKSMLENKLLLQHCQIQIKIMYNLNHPNIIKFYNCFQDSISIFLVLQYAAQGQLYHLLSKQSNNKLTQKIAIQYIRQITEGVQYIHQQGIMHRDLKLQNILVDQFNNVKIADFGWSNFTSKQKRTTYCGSPDYLAPQMLQEGHKHDNKVDIWSIGVLIYELCTGCSPFSCSIQDDAFQFEKIKQNIINVNYTIPQQLSQNCKDLIKNLLKMDPKQRLTTQQILNHKWLKRQQKQVKNKIIEKYYNNKQIKQLRVDKLTNQWDKLMLKKELQNVLQNQCKVSNN